MTPTLSIRELLVLLRRHRRLALGTFAVVFSIGCLLSMLLPETYTSTMRILVKPTPSDLRSTPDRADGTPIGGVSEEEVNSEAAILTNYDILREAVKKNSLFVAEHRNNPTQRLDAATRRLGKDLSVTTVRRANIIDVQYSAKSPQLAANVLRTIENAYLLAHLKVQSTPGGYTFFQNAMEYYRSQLADQQATFAQFSESQNAVNLDQQLMLLTKLVSDQEVALQQTEAQASALRGEIDRSLGVQRSLTGRIATVQKQVPNLAAIDHLMVLFADLQDRRIQQLAKFRDDDVVVQETEQEIAAVRKQLLDAKSQNSTEATTDINPITQNLESGEATRRVELAGLDSKVMLLRKQISTNRSTVYHLLNVSGKYHLLSNDVQNAQDNYNSYVQRQESARISESLDKSRISNIVIAQEPTESVLPVSSHRLLIIAFSFFVAVFGSITACMFAPEQRLITQVESV